MSENSRAKKKGDSLATMLLPELQEVAARLEIEGAAKMRKGDLVAAIEEKQAENRAAGKAAAEAKRAERQAAKAARSSKKSNRASDEDSDQAETSRDERVNQEEQSHSENRSDSRGDNRNDHRDDDDSRRGRNRHRDRGFDRGHDRGNRNRWEEPVIAEDDVLIPVGGILDILENYAFVRTGGYLPGPNDVYVSLQQVRRHALRKGDVITGQVRQPKEGERREKFNALVRLDSVNGSEPEEARNRIEFAKLVPLYPQQRLRLETDPSILTTRVIDLIAPIGKGQRGLIVSPPKAGKTMVLQSIANAITTNNPECHLMVVLVDERPEEVTDMQRSVKGEVIASTFDRPAEDHTIVAEQIKLRKKCCGQATWNW